MFYRVTVYVYNRRQRHQDRHGHEGEARGHQTTRSQKQAPLSFVGDLPE